MAIFSVTFLVEVEPVSLKEEPISKYLLRLILPILFLVVKKKLFSINIMSATNAKVVGPSQEQRSKIAKLVEVVAK